MVCRATCFQALKPIWLPLRLSDQFLSFHLDWVANRYFHFTTLNDWLGAFLLHEDHYPKWEFLHSNFVYHLFLFVHRLITHLHSTLLRLIPPLIPILALHHLHQSQKCCYDPQLGVLLCDLWIFYYCWNFVRKCHTYKEIWGFLIFTIHFHENTFVAH